MGQFVCDGTCAGNEFGDCNHGDSNDGLHRTSEWNLGYAQAVEEVLSEVAEHSPTMMSAIVNRFPVWKAIMQHRADQQLNLSISKAKSGETAR